MNPKFFKTIRGQLIFGVSITIIILSVIFNLYSYFQESANSKTSLQNNIAIQASLISSSVAYPLKANDLDAVGAILDSYLSGDNIIGLTVYDDSNKVLLNKIKESSSVDSSMHFSAMNPILFADKTLGVIEVLASKKSFDSVALRSTVLDITLTMLQLIISILIISFISIRITTPLVKMEHIAEKIADNQLDNDIAISSNKELNDLGLALYRMQSRLLENRKLVEKNIADLNNKNALIQDKTDEIQAYYQQASALNDELSFYIKKAKSDYKSTVLCLANAIEASDPYTRGHCERVRNYSLRIAKVLNLSEKELEILDFAAMLHDIGKIGIAVDVLNKPNDLTNDEYDIIKFHPQIGYEIIKNVEFLKEAALVIYQHHERIDGKGYPNHVTAAEISILARILSAADAFDAMTSIRPYRQIPFTFKEAYHQLKKENGTHFDPIVIEALYTLLQE